MAFRREKISDLFLRDTSVENMFINEYMATAPGDYVKIYLMAQMYADVGMDITNEAIARSLAIEEEDVLKAWNYWEKKGVVRKHYPDEHEKLNYDVEFLSLKEQLYGSQAMKVGGEQSLRASMADKDIQDMLNSIEKMTGSVMNGTEVGEIIKWVNDYQVSPEVIVLGYKYSLDKKKRNIKYIEAVIRSWADEGLRDVESVEKKLSEDDMRNYRHKRVFRALGFNRNPSEEERRIMNTWFDDMGFTVDTVLDACAKTTGISNPNINYVNKVLSNWKEKKNDPVEAIRHNHVTVGEAGRYYELLREVEAKAAEKRRQQVYEKVPRIKEIEDILNASAAEMSKIIISDREDKQEALEALKMQNSDLNLEEAFLLTDNGFEVDHMDVKYQCELCKDTGMLETGERCQCFGQVTKEKIDLLMKQAK